MDDGFAVACPLWEFSDGVWALWDVFAGAVWWEPCSLGRRRVDSAVAGKGLNNSSRS
jgi:hypothetical protein